MSDLPEDLLYEGVRIDIAFGDPRPVFGDLFLICGDEHPRFPPSGRFAFGSLANLQFDQVDDYFGVRSLDENGDDVVIWLFPLVSGQPVHHHSGPFDAVRLEYNILRNPAHRSDHYMKCVIAFSKFGIGITYCNRKLDLPLTSELSQLRVDIDSVVRHWAANGIEVGSNDALMVEF